MNSSSSFATFVAARLHASAGALHRYLLIDQAAMTGCNVPRELRWTGAAADLLTRRAVDWQGGASPVLLQAPEQGLNTGELAAWKRWAERWQQSNAMGYLESPMAPDTLAKALAERLRVKLDGGIEVIVRWFDARVLGALMGVLSPVQLAWLLRPTTLWVSPTRQGGLCSDPRSNRELPVSDQPPPLVLTQSQESALLDLGEADAIIDILLTREHPALMAKLPAQQHQAIVPLRNAARAHGLHQISDLVLYCVAGLEEGEGFDQREPWRSRLAQAAQTGCSLMSVVAGDTV